MLIEWLSIFAALLITLSGVLILMAEDWRVSIGLLAVQYLGVFTLTAVEWPLGMAITRLVAGWIAGAVLGMAMLSLPETSPTQSDIEGATVPLSAPPRRFHLSPGDAPNPIFLILSAALVGLAVISQTPRLMNWIPNLEAAQGWGGLILIGLGLLKMGFHSQPLHVILGLLLFFSGFELLYLALSAALLTAALSAAVTLTISLTGAYLLLAPHMEANE
ncbi:MAG: hypothetical protein QME21_07680 [Anaerolineales bacterium]|nr:hypothetical protein [Anaerolineales bacterium]